MPPAAMGVASAIGGIGSLFSKGSKAAGGAGNLAAGLGGVASGIGSIFQARSGQPKFINTPPPNALFPGLQQDYISQLQQGGLSGLQQMSRTGQPVDIGQAFQAMMMAGERTRAQGQGNLLAGLGARGTRFGSTARNALIDYNLQSGRDLNSLYQQMALQSSEGAANRSLSASSLLGQLFSGAGMAFTPSGVLASGGQSALGTGLQQFGQAPLNTMATLQLLGLLKGPKDPAGNI